MTWPWPDDIIRPRWPPAITKTYPVWTDAKRCRNSFSCAQRTYQGKDFELILTIKMETRPFGSEFPAICIIAELWRPEVARPGNFVRIYAFFGKTTPYGKISKILFRKFTWRHRSTLLCSNVVKFVRRKIGEIVGYSYNKFRLPLKLSLLRGSRTKSTNIGSHSSRFQPNRFTLGGVIAEHVKTVLWPRTVFSWLASKAFEANKKQ